MARQRRRRGRSSSLWFGTAVVIIAVVVGVGILTSGRTSAPSPGPSTATGGNTSPANGGPTYSVVGNHILANGQEFTPYGITVFGLSYPQWQAHRAEDQQQILATAASWHANTVRIQVAPPDLFDAAPYDAAYLSAVEQECALAQQHGLNVILAAQYERTTSIPMPDTTTLDFWRVVAPLYAHDPGVWFDLFNEPALGVAKAGGLSQLWGIWRNGGSGHVGMQQLVSTVRAVAPNVVLAEGIEKAKSLQGLSGYELVGGSIAYAVHPYFVSDQWSSTASWDQNWGDLSAQVPVVIGEWGEYQTSLPSCRPDAPSLVPEFLDYLGTHGIGLIAWSLTPGVLVVGTDLSRPTDFAGGMPFTCGAPDGNSTPQGSGSAVLDFFATHAAPAPKA
jgi:hypothetical protein